MSYDTGTGVDPDPAEAARWFRRAAEQGEAAAQQNLGVMYANGDGVPRDFVTAHQWLSLATVSLEGTSQATATGYRDIVAQQLSPAQLAEAERRAKEWVRTPER
jgi:hypothetical protein